jgi:uncharacterized membrane protein
MTWPNVIWGSPRWSAVALAILGVALLALLWSYLRARTRPGVRLACFVLKAAAFVALAACLLEPLLTGTKPRRGANAFAVVADNSRSLSVRDDGDDLERGTRLRDLLLAESPWQTRLAQDFDVRRYAFDSHLRALDDFGALDFRGDRTSLAGALDALARRFKGLPLAGALLFTDGNATDALADADLSGLPPIFPVVPTGGHVARDVGVGDVAVSQTNFEAAPAVIRAEVDTVGLRGETIVAALLDESGRELERQEAEVRDASRPLGFRFQFRPEARGASFYRVRAFASKDEPAQAGGPDAPTSIEQTLANNDRLVVVDQGGGPYRVLYASGRPNWEFKFLRRAVEDDDQVQLVGLLRIARKQPKFDFQAARSGRRSPFYQGFENPDDETAEAADEAVLVRLGTEDEYELRGGFPKDAEDLYRYHAVILDDLEAGFFTPDQLALLRNFVSVRGGGLLMLGGPDSFADGRYDRTPVGEMLPVYLDRGAPAVPEGQYRLSLTREGWLQPWVRTRKTEDEERRRLASLPAFHTLSRAGNLKPGAVVLAEVLDESDAHAPALAAQPFGQGRVAAVLLGDLWRWGLRREDPAEDDFDRAWRQTVRWLVADVPRRVELDLEADEASESPAVALTVKVRDAEYRPLDNASVAVRVTLPDGGALNLDADPHPAEPGAYVAKVVAREPGPYRIAATARAPDGSDVGEAEAGWAAQPAADEFARLDADRDALERLARGTGGEVVTPDRLDGFVAGLSARDVPITEPWTSPLWHQPAYFLAAIACLAAEWGLRRVHGLA